MTTSIDKILLRQDSSCEIPYCIGDVPTGTTITQAWFVVKPDLADPDDQALISKTIFPGVTSSGQITDVGASGTASLIFVLDDDDANALSIGTLYMSAVKVLLDSGLAYQPPYTRRPTRVVSSGIERVS